MVFALELCAYAVMSNHYHLVVPLNLAQAGGWTEEMMSRWERQLSLACLMDVSWYMRSLNEDLARRANEEGLQEGLLGSTLQETGPAG